MEKRAHLGASQLRLFLVVIVLLLTAVYAQASDTLLTVSLGNIQPTLASVRSLIMPETGCYRRFFPVPSKPINQMREVVSDSDEELIVEVVMRKPKEALRTGIIFRDVLAEQGIDPSRVSVRVKKATSRKYELRVLATNPGPELLRGKVVSYCVEDEVPIRFEVFDAEGELLTVQEKTCGLPPADGVEKIAVKLNGEWRYFHQPVPKTPVAGSYLYKIYLEEVSTPEKAKKPAKRTNRLPGFY